MNCPPELADILLELLQTGLLRIRMLGQQNDAQGCALEADHLHNLPALLTNYSADLLGYYWNVERPAYLARVPKDTTAPYTGLWDRVAEFVTAERMPSLSS